MTTATNKKTMYEILEVLPSASLAEIKAAHRRISLEIISESQALGRDECNYKLNLLDVALHTLSLPSLRDAYDAKLASEKKPGNALVPLKASPILIENNANMVTVASAIQENHKIAAESMNQSRFPIKEIATIASATSNSLKMILRIVAYLLGLGIIITMTQCTLALRHKEIPDKYLDRAQEKLAIQAYHKKYGYRPASRAEAELLEGENKRKENERRQAEFEEKRQFESFQSYSYDSGYTDSGSNYSRRSTARRGSYSTGEAAGDENHSLAYYEDMKRKSEEEKRQRDEEVMMRQAEERRIIDERLAKQRADDAEREMQRTYSR